MTVSPTLSPSRPAAREPSIIAGITVAAVVAVVALPVVLPSASLATEVLIFAVATLGCSLLLGYTGLLSFGQAIFFGAGAYVASLVLLRWEVGFIPAVVLAALAGGVLAAVVGALSIRRRGIYFVMLTLAFTQLAYFVAYTATGFTGGENGLLDVPRAPIGLFSVTVLVPDESMEFYWVVAAVFIAVFVAMRRVVQSPFGSTLAAIRENEERSLAIGYDTRTLKILAFVISGMVTAIAGALYAIFLGFAPLSNVELMMSEYILLMTIIGGTGSLFGSLLGAGFLVVVGDYLSAIWPRWLLALGVLLIALVLFMRDGLWGAIETGIERLRERKGSDNG